ncbi:MAG: small multi-drug export protein [Oscillospiraceae bacterium]|nr:small multi-drug export protein [Oscillospiraceae bacterium]
MLPVGELRIGLPYGIALGLPFWVAFSAAVLGNTIPIPFIIIYIKRIFAWLRKHWPWLNGLIAKLESRAEGKGDKVEKYGTWGLLLLVAIPLPGTGAWTGSLVAALLDLKVQKATPVIFIGVCIAGAIMSVVTYGAIRVF